MSSIAIEGPNAQQIDYWNNSGGLTWAEMQPDLDRQLESLGLVGIEALSVGPGQTIIDVGCGSGGTSLELARRVGPKGRVFATDISQPQLAIAERRAKAEDLPQMSCVLADAQTHPFWAGIADGVFSRFGVMFFSDPPAAFANLRRACKSGGRLAFICWRPAALNPWMTLPFMAALSAAPELAQPPAADPYAPGPFAFADDLRVRGILHEAGWTDIEIRQHDQLMGVGDLEDTLNFVLSLGQLGSALRQKPDLVQKVTDAVRDSLRPFLTDDGVKMGASVWIVTARAP